MGMLLPVENGKVQQNYNADGTKTEEASSKSQLEKNKDMFLQLLVAEMQYQDPLEPTDNSEYIQQLYSMSQTESILAVQDNVQDMSANALVGQYVTVQDPETGEKTMGKVDFITEQGGTKMLSIEGNTYDVANVIQVHDPTYYEAVTNAGTFTEMVEKLPAAKALTIKDKDQVDKVVGFLSQMNSYETDFISDDTMKKFTEVYNRMVDLVKAQEGSSGSGTNTETSTGDKQDAKPDTEATDKVTEGTDAE